VQNPYQTLGLPVGASLEAVQGAYRKALRRFLASQQAGTPLPQEDFEAVQAAYAELGTPERKAAYDQQRALPRVVSEPLADHTPDALAFPPKPAAISGAVTYRFEFTGSGGEYFRIWIVNLLLTILSCGIYSAWAKVRREQYFRRNTLLNGSGFDYHGNPKAILKGRLIAWGGLLILTLSENLNPTFYLIAVILLSPVLPLLLWRSFRFRARNTSWRGLRFDFHGNYPHAFITFIAYGLLTLVTLGLAFPLMFLRIKQFQINNLSFGGFEFNTRMTAKDFYSIFLVGILISVGCVVAIVVLGIVLGITEMLEDGGLAGMTTLAAIMVFVFFYFMCLLFVNTYIQVNIANQVWNKTRLAKHQFASDQRLFPMFGIVLSNWFLILLTLGLYWPWARVRLAAYRAQHLSLITTGSLDDFIGCNISEQQALGEGFADAFDFDIAL
jgi:uncharacterized membrane protein YjgN (DUF898 family)